MRAHCYLWCLALLLACSQKEKDIGIRQMISAQAKQEIAFAAVDYTVVNGVVTLRGSCATEQEKEKVESKVKGTSGVKDVQNNIIVAPVVLNGDHLLKRSVDSVLTNYPSVSGSVKDGIVYLQGQVNKSSAEKLRTTLTTLKLRTVDQLVIARE